jgi:hypothetical protein
MVVGRVEMTKTDACGQEILCLPRETDSIIGVKFGQTRNSSPQEIREFTTERTQRRLGAGLTPAVRKNRFGSLLALLPLW